MKLQKGHRNKLITLFNPEDILTATIKIDGNIEADICCFAVDNEEQLVDDRYMIFYNQLSSPENAIELIQKENIATFNIILSNLPNYINKLVFSLSLTDRCREVKDINSGSIIISNEENELYSMEFSGNEFSIEKTLLLFELYKKPDWRIGCVMSGFKYDLSRLLVHFGGEEKKEEEKACLKASSDFSRAAIFNSNACGSVYGIIHSLTKTKPEIIQKLEPSPALKTLVNPLETVFIRHSLDNTIARIIVVSELSSDLSPYYENGTICEITSRMLPCALMLDDSGYMELWYYGGKAKQMKNITPCNYDRAVPKYWQILMLSLQGGTQETNILDKLTDTYKESFLPVYILVITRQGEGDEAHLQKIASSTLNDPIYWQFIGLDGMDINLSAFEPTPSGNLAPNADFYNMKEVISINDEEFYDRILRGFAVWSRKYKL